MSNHPPPPASPLAATQALMEALEKQALDRLPPGSDPWVLPERAVEGEVLKLAKAYQAELDHRAALLDEAVETLKTAVEKITALSTQVEDLEAELEDCRESGGDGKRVEELEEAMRAARRTLTAALKAGAPDQLRPRR